MRRRRRGEKLASLPHPSSASIERDTFLTGEMDRFSSLSRYDEFLSVDISRVLRFGIFLGIRMMTSIGSLFSCSREHAHFFEGGGGRYGAMARLKV